MYISIMKGNYYLPSIYNIDSNCRCRLITKARSSRNRMELAFLTKKATSIHREQSQCFQLFPCWLKCFRKKRTGDVTRGVEETLSKPF